MKHQIKSRVLTGILVKFAMFMSVGAQPNSHDKVTNDVKQNCDTLIAERVSSIAKVDGVKVKRLSFPIEKKFQSPLISNFIRDYATVDVLGYRLDMGKEKAIVMTTARAGTSKEDSIQDWLIQVAGKGVRFRSVAMNPNLVFWDKGDKLNYLSVVYSEGSSSDVPSSVVYLDLNLMQFLDGEVILLDSMKQVQCVLASGRRR